MIALTHLQFLAEMPPTNEIDALKLELGENEGSGNRLLFRVEKCQGNCSYIKAGLRVCKLNPLINN